MGTRESSTSGHARTSDPADVNRSVEVGDDRRLSVSYRERAEPGRGQVVVEVAFCGICGSDLHFRDEPAWFPSGTVPGHEVSARIARIGEGVQGWRVDDRVSILPVGFCGSCPACLGGDEHVCPGAGARGVGLGTRPGGYAEELTVDAGMLFALPDSVSDRAGAFVEPLAVAVHAVEKAQLRPGSEVVVIGAGPIGLLTALVAKDRGFDRTVLVSRNEDRAQLARTLGLQTMSLTEVEAGALETRPPTHVFECAGTSNALVLALSMSQALGRIVLAGLAMEPLQFNAASLVLKEIELHGTMIFRRADFQAAIDLLAAGRIPVESLVTATAPLERTEELFQELTAKGNSHMKVLLHP